MTGHFFRNLKDDGFKNQDSKKATFSEEESVDTGVFTTGNLASVACL